jgi:hypothetical protein
MVIYPIPAAVIQARVQLTVDETAKVSRAQINEDVQVLLSVRKEAEQEVLLDITT